MLCVKMLIGKFLTVFIYLFIFHIYDLLSFYLLSFVFKFLLIKVSLKKSQSSVMFSDESQSTSSGKI